MTFIILGIERIALGLVGRITVLAIKYPQIGTGVQFRDSLDVYDRLELDDVDVGKECKDSQRDSNDEQIFEQPIEKPERIRTPGGCELRAKPVRERTGECLLEIRCVA